MQRDMAAGDVWRLQKEQREAKERLVSLTKHNRKFLYYRDLVLPELEKSFKIKTEKLKAESKTRNP